MGEALRSRHTSFIFSMKNSSAVYIRARLVLFMVDACMALIAPWHHHWNAPKKPNAVSLPWEGFHIAKIRSRTLVIPWCKHFAVCFNKRFQRQPLTTLRHRFVSVGRASRTSATSCALISVRILQRSSLTIARKSKPCGRKRWKTGAAVSAGW